MTKKGGDNKEDVRLLDTRIILVTLICVFMGALFVLIMIFFGMRMEHTALTSSSNKTSVMENEDIIGVQYDHVTIPYSPDTSSADAILRKYCKDDKDCEYYVIKNKAEYDEITTELETRSVALQQKNFRYMAQAANLDVDSDFFASGSVILFNVESEGLKSARLSSLTRDQNYNLTAEIRYEQVYADEPEYVGFAMLVKVPNIQPKAVLANYQEEIKGLMEDQ